MATELTCQVASLGPVWLQAIKTLSTCAPPNRQTNTPNHPNVFDELRRIDVSLAKQEKASIFLIVFVVSSQMIYVFMIIYPFLFPF